MIYSERAACGEQHPQSPPYPLTSSPPEMLPTGVIVGTATIARCDRNHNGYEWHLSNVKRLPKPRKPKRVPQPV